MSNQSFCTAYQPRPANHMRVSLSERHVEGHFHWVTYFVGGADIAARKGSSYVEGRRVWGPATVTFDRGGGGSKYARRVAEVLLQAAEAADKLNEDYPIGADTGAGEEPRK